MTISKDNIALYRTWKNDPYIARQIIRKSISKKEIIKYTDEIKIQIMFIANTFGTSEKYKMYNKKKNKEECIQELFKNYEYYRDIVLTI